MSVLPLLIQSVVMETGKRIPLLADNINRPSSPGLNRNHDYHSSRKLIVRHLNRYRNQWSNFSGSCNTGFTQLRRTMGKSSQGTTPLPRTWKLGSTLLIRIRCGSGIEWKSNGLIRQYFPKSRDFTTITDSDTQAVMVKLNNRPRKCLGF